MIARDFRPWFGSMAGSHPRVILTHGEDMQRKALGGGIQQRFGLPFEMPALREVIEF